MAINEPTTRIVRRRIFHTQDRNISFLGYAYFIEALYEGHWIQIKSIEKSEIPANNEIVDQW